jgi:uncharacterized protein YecE (DUF72 family)
MIYIGLAGWGDHHLGESGRGKLTTYTGHFPIVELDSSFYAIQPERNMHKWNEETPEGFKFVVKAYQGMTGHLRGGQPFANDGQMFKDFVSSIQPLLETGKLLAVLFQYPPWFECSKENVENLREAKERMESISTKGNGKEISLALEFRHQSWFEGDMRERTLSFMKQEGWIHSICDEPQAGMGSVPIVLESTHTDAVIVRFHGRNVSGWTQKGRDNWREVRYLYRYSTEELMEWKERLELLQKQVKDVFVIFNNNSGGDAAGNAKQLMAMLGIDYEGLAPRQLDLF